MYKFENGSDLFRIELNLIRDPYIKDQTKAILDQMVHYDNFIRPSSSTGKYHPSFDNVEFGNVNHTKAVVKLCNVLLRSRNDLSDYYQDIVYASAILHDMWKYDGQSNHTYSNHAKIAHDKIMQIISENINDMDTFQINALTDIAYCVLYHMGHWSWEYGTLSKDNAMDDWIVSIRNIDNDDLKDCIFILHYADMIASRNFYEVKDFKL